MQLCCQLQNGMRQTIQETIEFITNTDDHKSEQIVWRPNHVKMGFRPFKRIDTN